MTAKSMQTYCSALTEEIHPDFGPKPCAARATGPHPDPEIGYRKPLCDRHRAALLAEGGS
jgi:hypothetical protein